MYRGYRPMSNRLNLHHTIHISTKPANETQLKNSVKADLNQNDLLDKLIRILRKCNGSLWLN